MHPPPSCCAPSVPNKQPPRLLLSPPHRFALRQSAIANQQLAIANQHPLVSGSFWGRNRVIGGSFGGRFGVVLGSFWGRLGVGLGSVYYRDIATTRPPTPGPATPSLPTTPRRIFLLRLPHQRSTLPTAAPTSSFEEREEFLEFVFVGAATVFADLERFGVLDFVGLVRGVEVAQELAEAVG